MQKWLNKNWTGRKYKRSDGCFVRSSHFKSVSLVMSCFLFRSGLSDWAGWIFQQRWWIEISVEGTPTMQEQAFVWSHGDFCSFPFLTPMSCRFRTICGGPIRVTFARPRTRGGRGGGFMGRRRGFDPNLRCYQCGESGHFSRDCDEVWRHRRRVTRVVSRYVSPSPSRLLSKYSSWNLFTKRHFCPVRQAGTEINWKCWTVSFCHRKCCTLVSWCWHACAPCILELQIFWAVSPRKFGQNFELTWLTWTKGCCSQKQQATVLPLSLNHFPKKDEGHASLVWCDLVHSWKCCDWIKISRLSLIGSGGASRC